MGGCKTRRRQGTANTVGGRGRWRQFIGEASRKYSNIGMGIQSESSRGCCRTQRSKYYSLAAIPAVWPAGSTSSMHFLCCLCSLYWQMFDKFSNIVWSTTPSRADQLAAISEDQFLKELRRGLTGQIDTGFNWTRYLPIFPMASSQIGPKPPPIERVVGKRATFPLRMTHASEYVRPRLALIGWINTKDQLTFSVMLHIQFIPLQVRGLIWDLPTLLHLPQPSLRVSKLGLILDHYKCCKNIRGNGPARIFS